jgi:probable rRNA maturation factor
MIKVDIQIACENYNVPSKEDFETWIMLSMRNIDFILEQDFEIGVRVVNESESKRLNKQYRKINQSTNILSFFSGMDDNIRWSKTIPKPLGDLVICAPVIEREAIEQGKELFAHWAHMIVHGMLHLVGFDHAVEHEANEMESLEVDILEELGFPNPYASQYTE